MFFQHLFLIATIGLSLVGFSRPQLLERFALTMYGLKRGEYDRLLLSGFVHADYGHLIFNMITYYFFAYSWGHLYAGQLGLPWWLFGVFYLGAIVVSNIAVWQAYRKRPHYVSLGASGGISAVVLSMILLIPWQTFYVFIIPMPAIVFAALYIGVSIYYSVRGSRDNINHLAHLAGSLYGLCFSIAVKPDVLQLFFRELMNF